MKKILIDETCAFADVKKKRCRILTECNCVKCSFRKTPEELERGRMCSIMRLQYLPNFAYLYRKYRINPKSSEKNGEDGE